MVGLDNPLHIAMVLVVVLLVFGAKRLPDMGKSLGEGMRGFKDSLSGVTPMIGDGSTPDPAEHVRAVAPAQVPAGAPAQVPAAAPERVPAEPVA